MSIGTNIREKRKLKKMTLEELSRFAGVSRQTLSRYENGIIAVPNDRIEAIAKALDTSPATLMGWDKESKSTNAHRIPVYGEVAAGIPLDMIEDIIDYEEIPAKWGDPSDFFCLKIRGNSMEPRIVDGDVVVVRKQADADTGDIVIYSVNGDSAACKRLRKTEDGLMFIPFNNEYFPKVYNWEEVESLPVCILGRVIELRGKL